MCAAWLTWVYTNGEMGTIRKCRPNLPLSWAGWTYVPSINSGLGSTRDIRHESCGTVELNEHSDCTTRKDNKNLSPGGLTDTHQRILNAIFGRIEKKSAWIASIRFGLLDHVPLPLSWNGFPSHSSSSSPPISSLFSLRNRLFGNSRTQCPISAELNEIQVKSIAKPLRHHRNELNWN